MFQRKSLNTAVSMALGAMAAVSMNARADSTFFPHVVISDTVTTIVSVMNTTRDLYDFQGEDIPWDARDGQGFVHYRLFYKDAANNGDTCREWNTFLPTSSNDVQTIDLGADDFSGVLFEPTTVLPPNVPWRGYDYALGTQARTNLPAGSALRGYLLVDNAESDSGVFDDDEPTVFGEAFVVEFGVGATWGYSAFSKQADSNVQAMPDFDNEFDYEDAASISGYPMEVLPLGGPEAVTSAFMVTPVVYPKSPGGTSWADSDMSEDPNINNVSIYMSTADSRYVNWGTQLGMFDRDENPISGGIIRNVTCVGRVSIRSLISDNFQDTNKLVNGGWGRLINSTVYSHTVQNGAVTSASTSREYDAAVIYKLEYGTELNGLSVGGTWNNAFMIPNSYEVFSD